MELSGMKQVRFRNLLVGLRLISGRLLMNVLLIPNPVGIMQGHLIRLTKMENKDCAICEVFAVVIAIALISAGVAIVVNLIKGVL